MVAWDKHYTLYKNSQITEKKFNNIGVWCHYTQHNDIPLKDHCNDIQCKDTALQ